jgi:hypothetical protein
LAEYSRAAVDEPAGALRVPGFHSLLFARDAQIGTRLAPGRCSAWWACPLMPPGGRGPRRATRRCAGRSTVHLAIRRLRHRSGAGPRLLRSSRGRYRTSRQRRCRRLVCALLIAVVLASVKETAGPADLGGLWGPPIQTSRFAALSRASGREVGQMPGTRYR